MNNKSLIKKASRLFLFVIMNLIVLSGCSSAEKNVSSTSENEGSNSWDEVIETGSNKEVTILMWGGNESINQYMDGYVAENVKALYGITLKRVPMNAPDYLTKLLNEKKSGLNQGTADLVWINAENFLTAKEAGLLSEPFTHLLHNQSLYYDQEASDLNYDSGIPIEDMEAIWGKAQLVFSHDEAVVENPPTSYAALLEWVKKNPGKFTYPKLPDDFAGTAFVRNAYYELTGETDIFQTEMTQEEFNELSVPVIAYFNELKPYLWNEGNSYPATQAQLDELFKNGEVYLTMGFEVGKTAGLVASGVYPDTVKTFVFDTGTIGNSHYLSIPFNAIEPEAAMLVIDFLQSPEAQAEKMKSSVWGDMPAFDYKKLTDGQKLTVDEIEKSEGMLSVKTLTEHRLPEMKALYIDWIKSIWIDNIAK